MSSVRPVAETRCMSGEELEADDAWRTLRRHGTWRLLRESFLRFRYGDGFSHARGFALQLALATVPLLIAAVGLSSALGAQSVGEVVARTVVGLSPGTADEAIHDALAPGGDDAAPSDADADADADDVDGDEDEDDAPGEDAGELALSLGLLTAFTAATTAFAQLERGANRIYGVRRDRPALRKYGIAAALTATAGVAMATGLSLVVAGRPFSEAAQQVWGWSDGAVLTWQIARWPLGLAALVVAVTLLFTVSPRRRQPGWGWLGVGAAATVAAWMAASVLLALYVATADGFGRTYGPLTAVIALLLWANITGIALLGGMAVAAQLEAVRAGEPDPLLPDADDDGVPDVMDTSPHGASPVQPSRTTSSR